MFTFIIMSLIALIFGTLVAWAFFNEKIIFYLLSDLLLLEGSFAVILTIGPKPIPLLAMQIPNIIAALIILGTQIIRQRKQKNEAITS